MENNHKEEQVTSDLNTKKTSPEKRQEQKIVFVLISALVLFLLAMLIFRFPPKNQEFLSPEEAKANAEEFINNELMMPGTKATITNIEESYGLYKISVDVGMGEIIESYIDKQGVMFFPQALDIDNYVNPYEMMDFDPSELEDIDLENIDLSEIEMLELEEGETGEIEIVE